MTGELLTPDERELIRDVGHIYARMRNVAADGPARRDDLMEVVFHIHGLQRIIMAQAAARAYPLELRPFGGDVPPGPED